MRKIKYEFWAWRIIALAISVFPLFSYSLSIKKETHHNISHHNISHHNISHHNISHHNRFHHKKIKTIKQIDPFYSFSIYSMFGEGTITIKNKTHLIGKEKTKIDWSESLFQTNNLSSIRITDFNAGIWSILPSSQLQIKNSVKDLDENPFVRDVKLLYGMMRFKASGQIDSKTNYKSKGIKTIETNEFKVVVPRNADVVVAREIDQNQNKFISRVYSLNGTVYVTPNSELSQKKGFNLNNEFPLQSGLQFSMYEDGSTNPSIPPKGEEIENIIAFTTAKEELMVTQYYAANYNLEELLKICTNLEKKSEYFDILNLFQGMKNDFKNNAKIPYCLGVANQGLSQQTEAVRYFNAAILLDPNFTEAHWHLAQQYLELKNYELAQTEFDAARKNMDKKDKRYNQYKYFIAVSKFFENKYLEAKPLLIDCTWDDSLDPVVRESAADFLSKINISKPWSLIVPLSLSYDDNVLSLAQNQSLPGQFSNKSGWKSFLGAIYDYDSSLPVEDEGWFWGGGAKVLYVRNLRSTFRDFDALIAEGTVLKTKRSQDKDKIDSYKLYLTNGLIYIGNVKDTYYLLGGIKYKVFDFNLGIEKDISQRPQESTRSDIVLNQYYSDSFGKLGRFFINFNAQMQEKKVQNKSDFVGDSLEVFATPALVYPYSQKANFSFSQLFDFMWCRSNLVQNVYKFMPTLTFNYFMTSNLMGSISGIYQYSVQSPQYLSTYRPQASISITGVF